MANGCKHDSVSEKEEKNMLRQRASEHGDQGEQACAYKGGLHGHDGCQCATRHGLRMHRVYKRRGDQNFHGNVRVLGEMCNDSVSPSPTHNVRNSKKDARIRRERVRSHGSEPLAGFMVQR